MSGLCFVLCALCRFKIVSDVDYCTSLNSERSMEIPPVYNSFRRLLAYRVGQRFGLSHGQSDTCNEVCVFSCPFLSRL